MMEENKRAESDIASISVRPESCVALHRGQVCYQSIRLEWSSPGNGTYCLFSDTSTQELACSNKRDSFHIHAYASDSSERYTLRLQGNDEIIATAVVRTAWVYRTGKRSSSGWRLF